MNNLKLITTETFNNLSCNFYRNMNDDILLTREQIGQALEYAYPDDALSKIHNRHSDRLDPLSVVARLASTDGKEYDTMLYTERGVMEICRWSTKPNADAFMDWVWDIVEKYRHNELISLECIVNQFNQIKQELSSMNSKLDSMQHEMNKQIPRKKYSHWTNKMFPKYELLVNHLNITYKELYKNLFIEFQNRNPDIDLNQEIEDYCYLHGIDTYYTMDVIEHNIHLRKLFEVFVDDILEQYNLEIPEAEYRQNHTIFTAIQ